MASRLTGSSDLYQWGGRKPYASINFITCHDGFTLTDLVRYNDKHNEANGEGNRDGANDNNSWNCGVEGPTDDAAVTALRERQKRNMLATLLLSQGVPMLLAGDEIGHTQRGNNNAYCQDNDLTWIAWELSPGQEKLLEFTRKVIKLREEQPVLRRRKFFRGRGIRGSNIKDIYWLDPSGKEMTDDGWNASFVRCLGVCLIGVLTGEVTERSEPVTGDTLLVLFNAHHEAIPFTLPEALEGQQWERMLDTNDPDAVPRLMDLGTRYGLGGRSLAVFRLKALHEGVPPIIFTRG
jgi:glycogen operon protein